MILAGDVGGTKSHLALFDPDGPARSPVRELLARSREHASFDELLIGFLEREHVIPTRAVIGIAGPVVDNRCETTNLPWTMDGNALSAKLAIPVTLLNDLETTGWGLTTLGPADLQTLQPGRAADGNRALIAAGTGLGESFLVREAWGWRPVASEGGHVDLASRRPLEDELLAWLRTKYGRVSYERVLSGPGLANVYAFLTETGRGDEPKPVAKRLAAAPDIAPIVTETALDGSCERSRLAVEIFVEVYGAEAGNLALKALAVAGVYVGGGIAPRILPFFERGTFLEAFRDKGRLSPLVAEIPVHVILDARTALWGAMAYALANPVAGVQPIAGAATRRA